MEKALKAFVEDLKRRPECLAIAIFGSYARGQQRPDSDIDVFVVVPEGAWRDVEIKERQIFEMVYSSKEGAIAFYKANPNNAVVQWKDLKVLHDPQSLFEEIRAAVTEIEKQGKNRPNEQSIKHLRFDVEDKIRAVEYLAEKDSATAIYFLSLLGEQLFNAYFDLHQIWTPAPKQRLPYLRENDPDVARIFTKMFCDASFAGRIASAKVLAAKIFGS